MKHCSALRIMGVCMVLGFATAGFSFERTDTQTTVTKPADGIELTEMSYKTTSGSVALYALKVDLSAKSGLQLNTVLSQGKLFAGENPKGMYTRLTESGKDVVATINADFWESNFRLYHPVGMLVEDNVLFNLPGRARSAAYYTQQSGWEIGVPKIDLSVQVGKGRAIKIDDLNPPTTGTAMALFTWADTKTPPKGYAWRKITLDKPELAPNKPAKGKLSGELQITGKPAEKGELLLAAYTDANKTMLETLPDGAVVTITANFANAKGVVEQTVGGGPRLLSDGKPVVTSAYKSESVGRDFSTALHPRTAIGFNAKKDTAWLVVVDGRQKGYSIGINLFDLAELMKEFGCANATNLDGGGSSGMFVGDKYANRPSDATGARSVTNGMAVVRKKK